jgi:hypothetical protein
MYSTYIKLQAVLVSNLSVKYIQNITFLKIVRVLFNDAADY